MLIFLNFLPKFCFEQKARNSSLIGDIAEVFSKFTKFPVVIASGCASKASFCISRDHMINDSRDSMGEIPSSQITKVIVRATELNNKNIHVLQIGANLCYKLAQPCFNTNQGKRCYELGQLHYYKLVQVLLHIGVAITNQDNRNYKIWELLQIGASIANQGNYYKLRHNTWLFMHLFHQEKKIKLWTYNCI